MTVFTVGHSNAGPERFLALLAEHDVRLLVDIRTVPRSRRVPWSSIEELPQILTNVGIAYEHWKDLGGLRKPRPDSANMAWENASFRGYADYMGTDAFVVAIDRLVARAREVRLCIMCAEAVPWRCHRSMVADALVLRGLRVVHLITPGRAQVHQITSFAKVRGERITYPQVSGPHQARLL
ncbi:MAG: DUF488 domain-containing protein [Thermoplasmatota archaeon]